MMIRTLSLILMFSLTSLAQAEALYRWIEPDGSITFSPNKPPAGVDFKMVGVEKTRTIARSNQSKSASSKPLRAATNQQSVDASVNWMDNKQRQGSGKEPALAAASQGFNESRGQLRAQRTAVQPVNNSLRSAAQRNKRANQCAELSKRVTSLEERMKARLSPDAMDQTVITMVRYQQSFDKYCR